MKLRKKSSNHDKYITTPEFKKLTSENFTAKLKLANVVAKTDFDKKNKQALIEKLLQIKQNIQKSKRN